MYLIRLKALAAVLLAVFTLACSSGSQHTQQQPSEGIGGTAQRQPKHKQSASAPQTPPIAAPSASPAPATKDELVVKASSKVAAGSVFSIISADETYGSNFSISNETAEHFPAALLKGSRLKISLFWGKKFYFTVDCADKPTNPIIATVDVDDNTNLLVFFQSPGGCVARTQ